MGNGSDKSDYDSETPKSKVSFIFDPAKTGVSSLSI